MAKLDRTNISNGWYQIRAAAEAAFGLEQVRDSNVISAGGTYPAVVLHTGKSTLIPRNFTRGSMESSLVTRLGLGAAETEQYKLYFRIDPLNSNIPLPPSFRNVVFPEGYPISQGQGGSVEVDGQGNAMATSISARDYNTSSPLTEAYEEEMLISCHPSVMMTMDPSNPDSNPGKLNPGDVIEIRFVNNSFSSAVFEKVITRGLNIIKPILQQGSPIDLFDGETFELGDPPPTATNLGSNQAKYYQPASRGPNEINTIILHSTDGPHDTAQNVTDRFSDPIGPTLAYEWTHPTTGEKKSGWRCEDVTAALGGHLPAGTICHPKRGTVEQPVKTSIHYTVDQGGSVIQGVLDKDIAQHAGGTRNKDSIGIEMTGIPHKNPGAGLLGKYAGMYNGALIDTTAQLVARLSVTYNIPIDRAHIIGHYEFSPSRRFDPGNNKGWPVKGFPPGNYFNWDDFMSRVQQFAGQFV
jgi:hypothetical protein